MLYRKRGASYIQEGHTQRLVTAGEINNLRCPILHDDRKSLSRWLEAQSRYTRLEADKLLSSPVESLSLSDRVRRWRVLAPAAMLFYCLIIRGGLLDGWAGFYYAFQRSLAELMLSLHMLDRDLRISDSGSRVSNFKEPYRRDNETPTAPSSPQFEVRNPKSEIRNS